MGHPQAAARAALVAALAGVGALVAPAPADAHERDRMPDRTVLTYAPADPANPPAHGPVVTPKVCVRSAGRGLKEAVFGYVSTSPVTVDADGRPPRPNVIAFAKQTLSPDVGGQITQMRPGRRPFEFSVQFDELDVPTWQIWVPSVDGSHDDPGWVASITPGRRDKCDKRVPEHFAVVTSTRMNLAPVDLAVEPSAPGADLPLRLAGYGVEISYVTHTTCSAGGSPLAADVVYGWVSNIDAQFEPLERRFSLETRGNAEYLLTRQLTRTVVDPAGTTEVNLPTADVTGRCAFGRKVVTSTTFWQDDPFTFQIFPLHVDANGDALCSVTDAGPDCLQATGQAPGGTRFR